MKGNIGQGFIPSELYMATGAEQHGGMFDRSRPHTATNRPGSKSRRKIKVLPWCQDEKDRQIHTDYVKLLASMDSKSRAKASKHAMISTRSGINGGL